MLLGASDRRHRYVEDAVEVLKRQPLLGVVPNMSRKNDDPAQAAIAAMGVNQIRAMLQLGALAEQRRTFAITSGSAGEGKTSLSVALGMSFAHSGTRTLLIDFDLVGRSLSARCDRIHRERIGELLVRSGAITPAQLREAVDAAGERRTRLGEVLVSLGHLTQECLDESLQRQASTAVGLPDALEGAPLSRCVVTVGQGPKSLSILPGGFATAQYISSVSPLKLRELLQRAKREYDVVLVDTGPLPGSLEAAIVSTLVDEVLVVVSHGTHRSMANRAIEQLDRIGARVAGIVFNRALRSCVDRYGSSSQVSRWQEDLFAPASGQMPSERFGPLVSATAGYRSDEPAQ
jgi:Mrp family chromosome partitioning ATPase